MADYKSMYYELLLASERAITMLKEARHNAAQFFPPNNSDYFEAFNFLEHYNHKAVDLLFAAVNKSEDIYIETCDDDPNSQD